MPTGATGKDPALPLLGAEVRERGGTALFVPLLLSILRGKGAEGSRSLRSISSLFPVLLPPARGSGRPPDKSLKAILHPTWGGEGMGGDESDYNLKWKCTFIIFLFKTL